ncbi:hypothetical protein AB4212_58660, partial [Streptomyces sp. 2MCAF27]
MTSDSPTHPAPLERFQARLSDLSEGQKRSPLGLINALTRLDTTGDAADTTAALRMLGERPHVVLRLDEFLRWATTTDPAYDRPLALAFACSHHDGRIRERAVRRIVERPSPELMPFLVLRTGDWVRQ